MKKKNHWKIILAIIVFLLIIFLLTYLILKDANKGEEKIKNELGDTNENVVDKELTNTDDKNIQNKILQRTTDNYDYFISLYCLEAFYNFNEYYSTNLDFIDTDVIEELNLSESNVLKTENNGFCIDEIYKQNINQNENIYVVYFRIGQNFLETENCVVWIRINDKNKAFYIYPYEYLSKNNFLNYKENDVIQTDNLEQLQTRQENIYTDDDIVMDKETCMQELFSRYKFDLLIDRQHLYNTLDEKYRNEKFKTFNDFQQYIEENKSELYIEIIENYSVSDYDKYKEYTGTGKSGKKYIFNAVNMMEYTLRLDEYSIVTDEFLETYNMSLPNVKAKYCIDRIINAINNKDYEFVYSKLDVIMKSNYYSNIEDFKKYIQTYFWEENEYEFENFYMISDQVYQYTIKVTDKEGLPGYRLFTATVTLKNEDDFEIAIKMN